VTAATHDRATLETNHRDVNPHLRYADTHIHGFGRVHVTAEQMLVTLVSIDSITEDAGEGGPGVLREARFVVPSATGANPTLEGPHFTGELPFPWSLI